MLKQLVRDHIDPNRDLGHSDKHGKKKVEATEDKSSDQKTAETAANEEQESKEEPRDGDKVKLNADGTICEDCK